MQVQFTLVTVRLLLFITSFQRTALEDEVHARLPKRLTRFPLGFRIFHISEHTSFGSCSSNPLGHRLHSV